MNRLIYLKDVASLQMDDDKCVGCGMCLLVCPHEVFYKTNGSVRIGNRDACMECGACAKNCPTEAIAVQSGVGCANAVINAALGRKNAPCCCIDDSRDSANGRSERSTCC